MQHKELYPDDEKLLHRLSFPFCGNKIQYVLKKHAESVRRQMERISNTSFDKYKCRVCRYWHIGHTSAVIALNNQRKCCQCGVLKNKTDFSVRSNGKWLRAVCISCEPTLPQEEESKIIIHGIPMDIYNELLNKQNFQCALCNCSASELKSGYFNVDRDLKTGYIRGLVCTTCSSMLETLDFNVNFVAKILEYLLSEANYGT